MQAIDKDKLKFLKENIYLKKLPRIPIEANMKLLNNTGKIRIK